MKNSSAVDVFRRGGIIAYPTEAVYGLGCDPDNHQAIIKLLLIKNRPIDKGLILLASDYSQLQPYVDDSKIPTHMRSEIFSRWPDGVTQIFPANQDISPYLSGKFNSIAVRITSQKDVVALCEQTRKPIVSTSANLTGKSPAKTWQELDQSLISRIDHIIPGQVLGFAQPSTIIDALTGEVFRL